MASVRRIISILLILLLAMPPCQAGDDQILIRVGSHVPERSIGIRRVIKPWMEAVAADRGAGLRLDGYWGGALGRSPQKQYDLVRAGILDVAWVLPAYTSGQFPEMGLFELPFLFRDAREASATGWQLHQEGLLTGLEDVRLIGFFTGGPNALFLADPINDLRNLQRLKIRSFGAIHARWLSSWGAAPQTLSAADMNHALDRGVIDGAIQGWTGMQTFASFPLVDQAISIPLGATPFLLVMNARTWARLPEAARTSVMRHGGLALASAGAEAYTETDQAIHDRQASAGRLNIWAPSSPEQARYEQQAKAIHDDWIRRTPNGAAVYARALHILQDMRAGQ